MGSRAGSVRVWGRPGRRRRLTAALVVVLVASLLAVVPSPAAADPALPPGASKDGPRNPGEAVPLDPATTEQTQGGRGPGVSEEPEHPVPAFGPPAAKDWKPTTDRPPGAAEVAASSGFREGVSVEDASARTANTTEFVNPDGSRTRRIYQETAFIPDSAGRLHSVDTNLRSAARDGRLEPTMAMSPVSFGRTAGAADMARLDLGDGVSIGFGVDGAADVAASVDSNTATYRGVRSGADISLSATTFGMKDEITLHSASAPTSWVFPLRTLGVTPEWDEASKSIKLVDRRGNIAALIPPGFMVDSSFDQRTGGPATSTGVRYTLLPKGAGWALQVDLDQAWLADPTRAWPIVVDPMIQFWGEQDDTFVSYRDFANQNNSALDELRIGTYDWGGEVSESYLHFDYAMTQLADKFVTGAMLQLWNHWSWSCTPSAVALHAVAVPWAGWSTTSWGSRPAYYGTALDTQSFAHGYTGCGSGQDWAWFNIPADNMNAWADGVTPFYGFALRASYSDSLGWKKFRSSNFNDSGKWPILSVTYTQSPPSVAAAVPAANTTVNTLMPTLWVRANNPSSAPTLWYKYKVCGGTEAAPTNCHEGGWDTIPSFVVPSGWLSGWSTDHFWQVNIDNGTTQSGWSSGYFFTPVVAQPGVTSHLAGAPEGAEVPGVNPQVGNFATSATDATVSVTGPALSVSRTYNSQDLRTNGAFGPGWSTPWDQRVELDSDGSGHAVVTLVSGLQVRFGRNSDGITYSPPPGRNLDLVYTASPSTWTLRDTTGTVRVFDGDSGRLTSVTDADGRTQTSTYINQGGAGDNVAQGKATTSSTACNANETSAKAVNGTVNGGLSDKWCSVTGPRHLRVDLGSAQTISSAVIQHAGAGGEPTAYNTRDFDIQVSTDATNWTTVAAVTANVAPATTLEFAPVTARYVQLNVTTPTQTGETAARIYEFGVFGGSNSNARWLNTVTDVVSGRALHVGWAGNVISTVDTDVPEAGQSALRWSYGYSSGRLASVCSPLRAGACQSYTYDSSSHYRSLVLDSNPAGYWPLGETSGTVAANVAARTGGEDGTYNAVTLNATGALSGSPDPAATFASGSGSSVSLPSDMLSAARNMTVEAWFKAGSGASGNLVAEQNSAQTYWAPLLYVGTDGKVRGMAPVVPRVGPISGGGGRCMEPLNGGTANGTPIYAATCNGSARQQWRTFPDGTIRIFGKCFDITGANTAVFTPIQLSSDCHGNWNQVWEASWWGGVYNAGSTTCLGFDGNTFAALTFPCEVQPWTLWTIPTVTKPMASTATVTDGQWHHAVLSAGNSGQVLYLDGVQQGTLTGETVDHRDAAVAYIGNGKSSPGFPGGPGAGTTNWVAGNFGFTGQIDDVAYYRHALAASEVGEHYAARGGSGRLKQVKEPVAGVANTMTNIVYNHATGRVTTLTDRHGATWTLGAPVVNANQRTVHIANNTTPARSIDYTYDTQNNGRLSTRAEVGGGTRRWEYHDNGFVRQTQDEHGNITNFVTDARGNVTERQTCRLAGNCQTQYFSYFYNAVDKLDPRNDVQISSSDARSANDQDQTYQTRRDIDHAGRPLTITYPKPAGQSTNPVETFVYTDGTNGGAGGSPPPPPSTAYTQSTQSRAFITAPDALGLSGDDEFTRITLPFPVAFHGQPRNQAWVSTNGFVAFQRPPSSVPLEGTLPYEGAVNDAVFAFWDDLWVDTSASMHTGVVGTAPNRSFVVEWRNVTFYDDLTRRVSVEVVFAESGEVSTNYTGIDADNNLEQGESATVGIENAPGTEAIQYSHHDTVLASGTAVVYTPNAGYVPTWPTYNRTTQSRTFTPATTVLSLTGDDAYDDIALPFPITMYGQAHSTAWVSTNGFVAFTDPGASYPDENATHLPTIEGPNDAVYPFWDDLVVDGAASILTATLGTAPNRQFVVEWRNVYSFDYPNTERFNVEVVFAENGEISFNYSDVGSGVGERGGNAIIGIENTDGVVGHEHAYRETVVATNQAIVYTPAAAPTGGTGPPPPAGLLKTHTARNGAATEYAYNNLGDRVRVTDPVGLVTTNTHDNLGRIRATTRSAGAASYGTTTITYNGLSLPETVTAPAITNTLSGTHQAKTILAYNDMGQRTSQTIDDIGGTDPDRVTTWQYDNAGRLRFTTNPDNTVVEQRWNTAGDMTDKILPTGLWQLYTYDYAHRVTLIKAKGAAGVDPENPTSTADLNLESRSYDASGRLAAVADAKNRITRYTYTGDNLPLDIKRVTAAGPPETLLTVQTNTYDAAGHLTTRNTPGPNTAGATTQTTYTYDPAGNVLSQAVDPAGLNRVTTHSYNLDSTVAWTTATGAASPGVTEKVSYTYDDAGRVLTTATISTVTSAALTTTVVRDARGLVTQQTDPSGVTVDNAYDLADRLVTSTGESRTTWINATSSTTSPVVTTGYNTFGDVTHQRDPNNNTTVSTFNNVGQPLTVTRLAYTPPVGSAITATTSTHYTNGLADSTTDPLGNVTTVGYDKFGHVTSRTEPDPDGAGPKTSPQWSYTYNRNGELVETLLPTGAKTGAEYNVLGRQTKASETEAGGTYWWHTLLEYDEAGNQISAKTPQNQYVTTTTYNRAGEVTRVTDHTGRFTATSYDLAGRATYNVSGRNTTYASPGTTTAYDFAGRATSTADCAVNTSTGACTSTLRTTSATYDNAGRILSETSAANRPTTYGYDIGGQLTSITERVDPANSATAISISIGYDPAGNNTRLVDGKANATIYTYNTWNQPESIIEPSTATHPAASDRTWTTSYNANGMPVLEQLPGGVSRTKTYDNLNRLTAETGTGATTTARSLDYDALGRTTSATSPAGNHTYTWTDRGLLASATGHGSNVTLTYNGEGLLTQQIDTTGTANLTYDGGGRLETISDPLTGTTVRNTYDDLGRPATADHGAGTAVRTYTYDNFGRLDTDTLASPATASIDYGYDLDDLLTSKTTTGTTGAGTNTYLYDGLSRLTSWTNPASQSTTYGYDNASNRTTVTTSAGTRTSTYDARNRITATTGAGATSDSYTYNPRGQLTGSVQNGQTSNYTYDAFERLTQVSGSATPTTTYTYDSLDRVAQRNGLNFGYHDLDNNPIISPAAAGETKLLRDANGAPLATKTGAAAATALVTDQLHGDTIATANPSTGALTSSALFEPWGNRTTSGTVPLGYQGGYTDPDTALTNAHARWYNPTLGTFTSRDTWTLDPNPLTQTNRYLYANGAPATNVDGTGHFAIAWPFAIPAAALATAALAATGIGVIAVTAYCAWGTDNLCGVHDAVDWVGDQFGGTAATMTAITAAGVAAAVLWPEADALQQAIDDVLDGLDPCLYGLPGCNSGGSGPRSDPRNGGSTIPRPSPGLGQFILGGVAALAGAIAVAAEATQSGDSAAAAAAANGTQQCDPMDELNKELLGQVQDAAAQVVDNGITLTGPQQAALDRQTDPGRRAYLRNLFEGNRVHIATRNLLNDLYPDQWIYRNGGRNGGGPDFQHTGSGIDVELTTEGEVGAHRRRGTEDDRYNSCLYAIYKK